VYAQFSQWAGNLGVLELKLSKHAFEWWKDVATSPQKCLWYLSRAHAKRVFESADYSGAKAAFAAFKDSFEAVSFIDNYSQLERNETLT
jgi:hypothetical protein